MEFSLGFQGHIHWHFNIEDGISIPILLWLSVVSTNKIHGGFHVMSASSKTVCKSTVLMPQHGQRVSGSFFESPDQQKNIEYDVYKSRSGMKWIEYDVYKSSQKMGMSLNIPYGFVWKCWVHIPNEIAIFHRDNDQQNHWVKRGTLYSDTPICCA